MHREQIAALHLLPPAELPENGVWPPESPDDIQPSPNTTLPPVPTELGSQAIEQHQDDIGCPSRYAINEEERIGLLATPHGYSALRQQQEDRGSSDIHIPQAFKGLNVTSKCLPEDPRLKSMLLSTTSSTTAVTQLSESSLGSLLRPTMPHLRPNDSTQSYADAGPGPGAQQRPLSYQAPTKGGKLDLSMALRQAKSLIDRTFATALKAGIGALHGANGRGGAPFGPCVEDPMVLSMPELQCACGHALGIYGDLNIIIGARVGGLCGVP